MINGDKRRVEMSAVEFWGPQAWIELCISCVLQRTSHANNHHQEVGGPY
jgi:hypothetical protein